MAAGACPLQLQVNIGNFKNNVCWCLAILLFWRCGVLKCNRICMWKKKKTLKLFSSPLAALQNRRYFLAFFRQAKASVREAGCRGGLEHLTRATGEGTCLALLARLALASAHLKNARKQRQLCRLTTRESLLRLVVKLSAWSASEPDPVFFFEFCDSLV